MKCHKPGTDQEAELTVSCNGFKCPEFIFPHSTPCDPDTVECFIPVSEGDQITVSGVFKGTSVHGAIDLLADGSFLADKRMEGQKMGEKKYWNRTINFDQVFDMPKTAGYSSIYPPSTVVEGYLQAKTLKTSGETEPFSPAAGDMLSVGSLAVVVSVQQKSEQMYSHGYKSATSGDWKNWDPTEARNGGILPSHELAFRAIDQEVSSGRRQKHRRHAEQTRFGHKPWATFIFYYRSRMAIEQAGCISKPDISTELESVEPGLFVAAPVVEKRKVTPKKKQTADPVREDSAGTGDEIMVKYITSSSPTSVLSPTPNMPAKKKLPLLAPRPQHQSNSLFLSPSPEEISDDQEEDVDQYFEGENDYTTQDMPRHEEHNNQIFSDSADMDFTFDDNDASTWVGNTAEDEHIASDTNSNIEDKTLPEDDHTFPSDILLDFAPSPSSVSAEDIAGLAHKEGVISWIDVMDLFTRKNMDFEIGKQLALSVANPTNSGYVLKTAKANVEAKTHVAPTAIMSVPESDIPVQSKELEKVVPIKVEPADRTTDNNKAPTAPMVKAVAASPLSTSNGTTHMLSPLKRPLSGDSLSRESTPSKRARIAELQARKEAVIAANKEKMKQKLAAEKALGEDRKRRAAEEEELEREIAELEQKGMELEVQTAGFNKTREMEAEGMDVE